MYCYAIGLKFIAAHKGSPYYIILVKGAELSLCIISAQ